MGRASDTPRLRRRATQALPILAGVLMASGLVRIGDGTGWALIQQFSAIAADAATTPHPPAQPDKDDAVDRLLAALKGQERQLADREVTLADREARLAKMQEELRTQMGDLEQAERDLSDLLKLAQTAADDDLTRLTNVYENMAPKEAAALFSEMSPIFAAGFLARMRPDAAAAIMAGLEPATAYSISVMIAGRNADIATDG